MDTVVPATNAEQLMTTAPTLSLEEAMQQAVVHHKAGRLPEAEELYRAILQAHPNQADAHHNLGIMAGQVGQHAAGLPFLKMALSLAPAQEQYVVSYARTLLATGAAEEAMQTMLAARERGMDTPALKSLRQTIAAVVGNAEAAEMSASVVSHPSEMKTDDAPRQVLQQFERELIALFGAARYAEMESSARIFLKQFPQSGLGWKALSVALLGQGKDALSALQKTAEYLPNDAEAHRNLAGALHGVGEAEKAVESYRRALVIKPDYVEAHTKLANVLKERREFDGAIAHYRRALMLSPDSVESHNNLGNILKDIDQLDNAVASFRRALEIKPDSTEALTNLGNVLTFLGELDQAADSYRRAIEIKPDFIDARSSLLYIHNYLSDQSTEKLLHDAKQYGDLVTKKASSNTAWNNQADPDRCLRVGLVSADLHMHPVGYFVEAMLASLATEAPGRIEVFAYSNHDQVDAIRTRIKTHCNTWREVAKLSDAQLAQQIVDDKIDILIDLSGHTAKNRLPMFAWKPAPVQASWLGYFATTGVAAMDYFIADPWTAPPAIEPHFTEKILRLPESYICFTAPDIDVPVAPLPALKNGFITFGCFNNLTKMNDAVVALWARVLQAVPNSRLLLKTKQLNNPTVRQNVLDRFARQGIQVGQLMLESAAPRAELLATYNRVDIALDPFPYPGGTTSVEALWMATPVLSLAGDRFLSHLGESILHNAGLPDWIAIDADDYVAKAVAHAGDVQALATLRNGLRQQVLASPLFDAPRFARHFESTLRSAWTQWCRQQQQDSERLPKIGAPADVKPIAQASVPSASEITSPRTTSAAPLSPQAGQELIDLFTARRFDELERRARALLDQYPGAGLIWRLLGTALQMQGKDALPELQKAAMLLPDDAETHCNLGLAMGLHAKWDEAIASYRRALTIKPDLAEAHYGLGNVMLKSRQLNDAAACFRRALEINPQYIDAHNNLGNVLNALGQPSGAIEHFRRALQLNPDYAEAHNNLGNALKNTEQLDQALESFRGALTLKPDFAEAHNNLGIALTAAGQFDEAATSFRRTIEIKPDFFEALGNLLFIYNYLPVQSKAVAMADALHYGDLVAKKASPYTEWRTTPEPERCLRVGLVSPDLRMHAVGYFVESMLAELASHSAGRIELFAYSNHAIPDAMTERIQSSCHVWRTVAGLSDEQLARQIHDDGIDILIDLAGHTDKGRLPMFAWKPAPIQASWLGYCATTGVAQIDYYIADRWTLPESEQRHFTEKVWYLPESYLCLTPPDADVAVSESPALESGTVTFGSFNNLSKMNDDVVALWARILHAVPGSRLVLKARQFEDMGVQRSVTKRFRTHGIEADKLILERPTKSRAEHLAAYQRIDIALDTFPYCGVTTTAEALWMGVPVLSLAGEHFLARQGVGLLMNAGLPEWIAADADDYVAKAAAHAGDVHALAALRKGLRQQVLASPLFNAPRFAQHFEQAMRGMWTQWCRQQAQPTTAAPQTLSMNDAWQQSLAHHQAGRLPEAEALYRAILQSDPNHPDANHNLGVLAAQVGQLAAGLPYLKVAYSLNPGYVQYVLSYAEALLRTGSAAAALEIMHAARERGLHSSEMQTMQDAIETVLGDVKEPASASQPEQPDRQEHMPADVSLAAVLEEGNKGAKKGAKNTGVQKHKPGKHGTASQHAPAVKTPPPQEERELFALHGAQQYQELESRAGALLKQYPGARNVWQLLAIALHAQGKDALSVLKKTAASLPQSAGLHGNLGFALANAGFLEDAIASYKQALHIHPNDIDVHNNLGNALRTVGKFEDAMAHYQRMLAIQPDCAEAYVNLGLVLRDLGRTDDAEKNFRRALKIKPAFAEAHSNLGNVLRDLKKPVDAAASYRRALEIKPDYAEAHSNLGVVLQEMGQLDEAAASFGRAFALQPNAMQHAIHAHLLLPSMSESRDVLTVWRDRFENGVTALMNLRGHLDDPGRDLNANSFYLAYHNLNDRPLLEKLSRCYRQLLPALNVASPHVTTWQAPAMRGQRIRVGFLSEYFVGHTIGKLFQGFIHHLDRSKFEVVVIHTPKAKQDSLSQHLNTLADKVLMLPARLASQQQALMEEKLDVLVYPDIGMAPSTYFLACARLAPVQVVSWGHPDSTGIDTVDYFVSATTIEPENADEHYSERLIRLNRMPCFYQAMMVPSLMPDKASLGLPTTGTLYGCPQTLFKFHPDFDKVLLAIAEGDPNGHIVLLEGTQASLVAQLKARWAKSAPLLMQRVLFLPPMPLDRFMGMVHHMDVLLDPIYFGSGNTLYEAMVYGIPVVTWPGQFMRGRIVAGAYRQMGVTDAPIAQRLEDYADVALAWGRDPARRSAFREASSAAAKRELFADIKAVRELENFLEAAVDAAAHGEKLPAGWTPGK
jgi:protein O-GlcNAc transferase